MQNKRIRKQIGFALVMLFLFTSPPVAAAAEGFDCGTGKHDYAITTKAPTENQDGGTIYTCKICGLSYSRVLPATGHTWGEWKTDKQPACTEPGHKYRICIRHSNDPHSGEETIPALGHSYKETATPPTCEKDGFKIYTCERCESSYTESFGKAVGHHYIESTIKESDCEHEGKKNLTCENCGDVYTETIPALGHSFSEWIVDQEPAEDEEGHRYKVCEYDSSHIIEENIERLLPIVTAQPEVIADTRSSSPSPFPNVIDITLISIILTTVIGFSIAIRHDLHVLRWGKKEAISYSDWLKKKGCKQ